MKMSILNIIERKDGSASAEAQYDAEMANFIKKRYKRKRLTQKLIQKFVTDIITDYLESHKDD